jgi:hypothetical protein
MTGIFIRETGGRFGHREEEARSQAGSGTDMNTIQETPGATRS